MGMFRHLTRRRFMQTSAAAALAAGWGARLAEAAGVPPVKPPKKWDIDLTYFQDTNWLHAPLWLSPIFKKDAGVGIKSREMYSGGDTLAKVLPQLLARRARFDWVQYPSLFFGTLAETGMLEPLDDYLAQYPSSEAYLKWVKPAYGEFYTKWNGKTYGLVIDGDIHVFHYRPSYFNNPELQRKFSKRFQRELTIPKTWQEFIDCARFFTEELSSQGIYGTSMVVNPPNFGWGFWFNIAASMGVNYFDANMNPQINSPAAVEALELYKEIISWGPPGKETMDIDQTIQRWQAGADVMSIWWIDLSEFTVQQQGPEKAEDQATAIIPGTPLEDGTIRHRAMSLWCRTLSIPRNIPDDIKEAAFYFIYRMSHPEVSDYIVADAFCGSDPFGETHFGVEAAKKYLQPNPQRGTSDLWPTNEGIFKTLETAVNHLAGNEACVNVGYPQFYWEGTPELADALGRNISKFIVGELTAQQALDEAAEEWVQIVQKLGIDKQKAQYANFIEGARKLGYKI